MRIDSDYPMKRPAVHGPLGPSSAEPGPTAARHTTPARKRRATVLLAALFAVAVVTPGAAASLRGDLDRALSSPYVSSSLTGALAIDLSDGRAVYRHNAGKSLHPASNEKLTVALTALDRLGPSFRIETKVLGQGALAGTIWEGRLVLKGYGDPSLSRFDLARLATQVRNLGITGVTGAIVGDESYYDKQRTGPGWKASYYKEESPPLSALIVDRGKVGKRIADNPALVAARAFRRELIAAGISVPGSAKLGIARSDAVLLGMRRSGLLSRLVLRMNRVSDNFYAEMLLKQVGARIRSEGTTAAGARVVVSELAQRGVPLDGVTIADGSGLSAYDRLTARALAALLISAWSDATIKDAFVASLPVAGVSGTLEDRMTRWPAYGNVYAKTGTTNTSSTLSGYVRTRYVFSILQNGYPIAWWYARRTQDRFATVLAGA
jgi:D-alanyl-D-alanine carboxypeptidase/D-alanyl-D-alanine-endopeptidase (penicillin-binding protein 4)